MKHIHTISIEDPITEDCVHRVLKELAYTEGQNRGGVEKVPSRTFRERLEVRSKYRLGTRQWVSCMF